jgi:uncharacterized protein with HEPN domain
MPSERLRLIDIRDNIRMAQAWTVGLTASALAADTLRFYAVIRCLEIIPEASRSVGADVRQHHPDIPWFQIAGPGNVYRHDYERVDAEITMGTVIGALPPLLAAVEAELATDP